MNGRRRIHNTQGGGTAAANAVKRNHMPCVRHPCTGPGTSPRSPFHLKHFPALLTLAAYKHPPPSRSRSPRTSELSRHCAPPLLLLRCSAPPSPLPGASPQPCRGRLWRRTCGCCRLQLPRRRPAPAGYGCRRPSPGSASHGRSTTGCRQTPRGPLRRRRRQQGGVGSGCVCGHFCQCACRACTEPSRPASPSRGGKGAVLSPHS